MPRPQFRLRSLFLLTASSPWGAGLAGLADHTWTFDELFEAVLGR